MLKIIRRPPFERWQMKPVIETIGDLLLDATCQVLRASGVTVTDVQRTAPVADWLDPIAVIGFGGDAVRGSVSFEVPWRVLEATHPRRSSVGEDLADWVAELANITVGGLKRSLRARGVSIQVALPIAFTTKPAESGVTRPSTLQYRLRAAEGAVLVRFTAEATPGTELRAPGSELTEVVNDIQLF